ncbi:MAG: DUF3043 domain-containing protein [Kineosporiaceae bacterium]
MFGRTKDSETATTTAPVAADPTAAADAARGKGRPTPRRREAQQRNRRVVGTGAAPLPSTATKEERKAARRAQRQAAAEQRVKARQALASGDERHLPDRDRGPARRWARDYVDARLNPGELFLPGALLFLLLGVVGRGTESVLLQFGGTLVFYGMFLMVIVDSVLLRRRVTKLATEKFGAEAGRGTGTYAMTRALQFRMTRLPKPQVKRGAKVG